MLPHHKKVSTIFWVIPLISYKVVDEYNEYLALYIKMKKQDYEDDETSFMKDKLSNYILKQVIKNGIQPDIEEILNDKDKLIEWYIQKQIHISLKDIKQIKRS